MRYENTDTFLLKRNARYNKMLTKRKINSAKIMKTQIINSVEGINFDVVTETQISWKKGTKMWKIAADYYGDGALYWVIALYNEKPTDAHWEVGDIVHIPHPHEYVIEALGF